MKNHNSFDVNQMHFNISSFLSSACLLGNNKFLVSKETMELYPLESETWKLGFMKQVYKGRIRKIWKAEVSHLSEQMTKG